jgi:hypothetical protein
MPVFVDILAALISEQCSSRSLSPPGIVMTMNGIVDTDSPASVFVELLCLGLSVAPGSSSVGAFRFVSSNSLT